jgi:hypothetical protein
MLNTNNHKNNFFKKYYKYKKKYSELKYLMEGGENSIIQNNMFQNYEIYAIYDRAFDDIINLGQTGNVEYIITRKNFENICNKKAYKYNNNEKKFELINDIDNSFEELENDIDNNEKIISNIINSNNEDNDKDNNDDTNLLNKTDKKRKTFYNKLGEDTPFEGKANENDLGKTASFIDSAAVYFNSLELTNNIPNCKKFEDKIKDISTTFYNAIDAACCKNALDINSLIKFKSLCIQKEIILEDTITIISPYDLESNDQITKKLSEAFNDIEINTKKPEDVIDNTSTGLKYVLLFVQESPNNEQTDDSINLGITKFSDLPKLMGQKI